MATKSVREARICGLHYDHRYTRCVCGHFYCDRVWPRCPRCNKVAPLSLTRSSDATAGKAAPANCYDATFSVVCRDQGNSEAAFYVTMELDMQLPFEPVAGMSIGLEPHSEWYCDESRIERVMWLPHRSRFLVRLEDNVGGARGMAQWRAELGWRVQLGSKYSNKREAARAVKENDLHSVAKLDGGFFAVSECEAEMLKFIEEHVRRDARSES